MTLTFDNVMTLLLDLHGGEMKYAHESEAEDNNER